MKTLNYLILTVIFICVACEKKELGLLSTKEIVNGLNCYYEPSEYNIDMQNIAMAVNEIICTNTTFKDLIKQQVNLK